MTIEEVWKWQERWSTQGIEAAMCLLDLRRRVEALEARAATEQSSASEPAPAADRPLWAQMAETYYEAPDDPEEWAAVLDVVADWLAARKPVHGGAVVALRVQARRAREGQ